MFVFEEIMSALFLCNHYFDIQPFTLLPTILIILYAHDIKVGKTLETLLW